MASGRHREALEAYRRLKQAHPEDPSIDLDMARLHESLGERGRALEILGTVAKGRPSPEVFYAYALLLGKDGQLKEAVRWIKLYLENSSKEETPQKDNARRLLLEWSRDSKAP
jgi:tetratricopeptide (TPR) repeat protein